MGSVGGSIEQTVGSGLWFKELRQYEGESIGRRIDQRCGSDVMSVCSVSRPCLPEAGGSSYLNFITSNV